MSKARELATQLLNSPKKGYINWVYDDLIKLCDAVLSEPEPEPMRGWIEVTDVCDSCPMLINLTHIEYVGPDGVMYSANEGEFTLKESYDEIKQKIKEARDEQG